MNQLTDIWIVRLQFLERNNLLQLNNGGTECFNGGFAVTNELPQPDFDSCHVRLQDLWGFSCAQASVGISPQMYGEFVLPYEQRGLAQFGLNCIACCEPVDNKLCLIKKIPSLRRVSVSEWNDFRAVAEGIGTDYIYSVKPIGAHVSSPTWEPELERKYLRDILEQSKGCVVELVNNSTSTCRNEPCRISEWTQIAADIALLTV